MFTLTRQGGTDAGDEPVRASGGNEETFAAATVTVLRTWMHQDATGRRPGDHDLRRARRARPQ